MSKEILGAISNPVGAVVSGIGGALVNKGASKDAAKMQTDAANQALAEQKRIFDLQRADRAPYLAQSQAALGSLGQLAGQGRTMPLPGPSNFGGPPNLAQMGQPQGAPPPSMPRPGMPHGPMAPPQGPPQGGQMPGGPTPPMGGLVTLKAPTGEVMQVPAQMADSLIQRGAQRLS